jgi:hypothetical protein
MVGIVPGAFACRACSAFAGLGARRNLGPLVPLLLLFGSLCQDLATFLCKLIDTQGVTKRPYRSFWRRWICRAISCRRRCRSRRATY